MGVREDDKRLAGDRYRYSETVEAGCRSSKDEAAARVEGRCSSNSTRESFKCGPAEILQIIDSALKKLETKLIGKNAIIAAGVRNGILAHRPNWSTKQLEPVTEQRWFTEGVGKSVGVCKSHRLNPDWCRDRYNWLDSAGAPPAAVLW